MTCFPTVFHRTWPLPAKCWRTKRASVDAFYVWWLCWTVLTWTVIDIINIILTMVLVRKKTLTCKFEGILFLHIHRDSLQRRRVVQCPDRHWNKGRMSSGRPIFRLVRSSLPLCRFVHPYPHMRVRRQILISKANPSWGRLTVDREVEPQKILSFH